MGQMITTLFHHRYRGSVKFKCNHALVCKGQFTYYVNSQTHGDPPSIPLPPSTSPTVKNLNFFTQPPSLPSKNVNNFIFFNAPSPSTANSKTLTFLLSNHPPLLPSTAVNNLTYLDPPSPPTVNNRQQILSSTPSHPPPLNVDVICE